MTAVRPGDVVTEEPREIGTAVLDQKGAVWVRWIDGMWRCAQGDRPERWWMDLCRTGRLVVAFSPKQPLPAEEWVTVTDEQVRVGDEIEITREWEEGRLVVSGRVTALEGGLASMGDGHAFSLSPRNQRYTSLTLRRLTWPIPEPGPGAVWECAGARYYNTGARDTQGDYLWTTPGDPEGSYDWDGIRGYGTPTELLAAPDLKGVHGGTTDG
jgi:hypothetical protein